MRKLFPLLLLCAWSASAEDLVSFTEQQRKATQIETAVIERTRFSTSAEMPGKVVVPNAQLHVITAPQRGLVETLLVAEGDRVYKGQALARIQSPALLELQSEYLEVYTRYRLAKSNYERDRKLNREGIVADRRLRETEAAYEEVLARLSRVARMLELSGMDEQSLTLLREERRIDSTLLVKAPFDGVVLEQMTTAGERVEAADPLYRIGNLRPLWLEIDVPLKLVASIHAGETVVVPGLGVSGKIITIGTMVHGADQGVRVRAEVDEGAGKLRPGQFVQVQVLVPSSARQYRVPRSGIVRHGGKVYVFMEQPEGFLPVPVSVVAEETDTLVIAAEVPADARIAVSGTAAIKAAWLGGE